MSLKEACQANHPTSTTIHSIIQVVDLGLETWENYPAKKCLVQ